MYHCIIQYIQMSCEGFLQDANYLIYFIQISNPPCSDNAMQSDETRQLDSTSNLRSAIYLAIRLNSTPKSTQ